MEKNTKNIYNETAELWGRRKPNSLSDYTARPRIFELCGDVRNKSILDLGSGEGYCARVLEDMGAASIEGVELSEKMVDLANVQKSETSKINYTCGDVENLLFNDDTFDLAIGVFVYNYMTVEKSWNSFREAYRVLKSGGTFIFSVPHPSFPFIKNQNTPPFYFDVEDYGYFSSRNNTFNGKIFCRDGKELSVQMIPKTLEDYFLGLSKAGFASMPVVKELGITESMIELDSNFFSPLVDVPLHLVMIVHK